MRKIFFLILLSLVPIVSFSKAQILDGEEIWQIVLTPTNYSGFNNPLSLRSYSNYSNKQRVIEAKTNRIVIERKINYKPLQSRFLLKNVSQYSDNPETKNFTQNMSSLKHEIYQPKFLSSQIISLAETLSEGKKYQVEYVEEVMYTVRDKLYWAATNSNDADSVLVQGYGTCQGFANLAIALLHAKGIPARHNIVFNLKHPSWNAGAHAEVEVYYDKIGWVSYDPQMHNHHAPFPRVWIGYDYRSRIYSDNPSLWKGYEFFSRNPYNVQYTLLKSSKSVKGMDQRPSSFQYFATDSGFAKKEPVIRGTIYDGKGNLRKEPIGITLDKNSNRFFYVNLDQGKYTYNNDIDGGKIMLFEPGYIILYHFPGYADNNDLIHDILFDESDSIVYQSSSPNENIKFYLPNRQFYNFKTDSEGFIRIHVNPGKYKVNGTSYLYKNGKWITLQE